MGQDRIRWDRRTHEDRQIDAKIGTLIDTVVDMWI